MDPCRPPEPPPRNFWPPPGVLGGTGGHSTTNGGTMAGGTRSTVSWWRAWTRKYVILCLACGGVTVLLGVIFIAIYFTLRSYTSSLQLFETIPTYVPATMMIVTGIIVMCFARRKNRFGYLIKLAGGCCLVCALLCVVITVTTTVVHMNRLQTLHECVYTPKTQSCMCVAALGGSTAGSEDTSNGHRFVFNHTPNCEVVHGSLYACLRGLFGLSVVGILVCIFSSMLVYQLLGHEKKKLYWEQLELRRRFLYRRHPNHSYCGCYDDFYQWHLWEMLLQLPPHATEEMMAAAASGRPLPPLPPGSGWNWFPLPSSAGNNNNNSSSSRPNNNGGFMRRLLPRSMWGSGNSSSHHSHPHHQEASPWRNEFVFRPPPGALRFGVARARNGARLMPGHRRTRSNDGVFHHLHMNPPARFPFPPPPPPEGAGGPFDLPRCLWGPPPPYSHPPSLENIATSRGGSGNSEVQGNQTSNPPPPVERESTSPGQSSKMSTPLSERRRFLCHNFSTEGGITLTIGGNPPSTTESLEDKKDDRRCIVEVHVPYIIHKNNDQVIFNTHPTRSSKKKDPFKSLSNIPICLTRKLGALQKHPKHQEEDKKQSLAVIDTYYNDKHVFATTDCPLGNITHVTQHKSILCDNLVLQPLVEDSEDGGSVIYRGGDSTIVEVPANYRSSLVISAESKSSPSSSNLVFQAQSMPNLTLHRTPSSTGDNSTSLDVADFELENDSSSGGSPVQELPMDPVLVPAVDTLGASFLVHSPPPEVAEPTIDVTTVVCEPPAPFGNDPPEPLSPLPLPEPQQQSLHHHHHTHNRHRPRKKAPPPSVCNCEPRHYPSGPRAAASLPPSSLSPRDSFIVTIKSVNV